MSLQMVPAAFRYLGHQRGISAKAGTAWSVSFSRL